MHSKKALLILNPTAGHYSAQRLADFTHYLKQEGISLSVETTSYRGHAQDIAQHALSSQRYNVIIAGGGDGTIAEVAQALYGTICPLAIWPIGSANVLARDLNIPWDDTRNAALMGRNVTAPLWPGLIISNKMAQPRLFLQMAGIGIDGWIVQHLSLPLKKRIGRLAYVITALSALKTCRWPAHYVQIEGKASSYRSYLTIISKGRFYGGPYKLFTESCYHQPVFSVLMLHSLNPYRLIKQLFHAFLQRHRHTNVPSAYSIIKGQSLSCTSSTAIACQSDGDECTVTPLTIQAGAMPLYVIAPAQPISQPPSRPY